MPASACHLRRWTIFLVLAVVAQWLIVVILQFAPPLFPYYRTSTVAAPPATVADEPLWYAGTIRLQEEGALGFDTVTYTAMDGSDVISRPLPPEPSSDPVGHVALVAIQYRETTMGLPLPAFLMTDGYGKTYGALRLLIIEAPWRIRPLGFAANVLIWTLGIAGAYYVAVLFKLKPAANGGEVTRLRADSRP